MKKNVQFLLYLIFSTLISADPVCAREIRVGVYSNEPKIFINKQGQADGIFPDLLKKTASIEKWELKFVPCEWERCLDMVTTGEIDLMPDVAQDESRLALFDFPKTPSFNSWSVLYRNASIRIQSFLDLENKSVAVLKNSVQQEFLKNALNGFGVNAKLIPVDSFEQGFTEVQSGRIDAIATNYHYASYASKKFDLKETPIIFLPSGLYIVTKKGANADILTALDYHFNQWREDAKSPIFHTLRKWTGEEAISVVPVLVWWALGGIVLIFLITVLIAAYLRKEVRLRTAEIRESERKLNSILNDVGSCIYIKDKDFRYQYVNRATCEAIGRRENEILGKLDSDLYDVKTASSIMQIDRNVIQNKQRYSGEEIIVSAKNNSPRTFFSVKLPLLNSLGNVYAICGISTDITDQRGFAEKLDQLSHFDQLTGLSNRTNFFDEAERLTKDASRSMSQCAILLINIDNFKDLNDSKGHQIGDLLLKELANQFRVIQPSHTLLARLTGDTFVFLIDSTSAENSSIRQKVDDLSNQIQSAVTRPVDLNGFIYRGSSSIGISIFDPIGTSIQDGFKHAEIALYQAKNGGKGIRKIFEPQMEEIAASRLKLEAELQEAIENGQFEVYFQPQVDKNRVLSGFEALIRWRHPKHGIYSPAAFVPLAESNGQILEIGKFVLETVCKQLEAWAKQPESAEIVLSINVSAKEFFDDGFVDRIIQALSQYNFKPETLELELTESQFISNLDQAIVKMDALKGMGFRLSIDDFGTGFSSLNRLKQLPFDQIKIDASFVRDMVTNQNDAAIIKTIIELGKTLGVEIIAEGVETQAQMDALIALGCEKFQGYLHGKPMPITEVFDNYPILLHH